MDAADYLPWTAFAAVVASVALLACAGTAQRYTKPASTPAKVSYDDYESLLGRYSTADGGVDYGRWHETSADVDALDVHLGRLTSVTPETHPALFADDAARLSYWINLYNGIVIREVLRRWPLESVRDVKSGAASLVAPGKGFFSGLEFEVGGRSMSLDDIEHKTIRRKFDDARVHFAINCGSSSCPVLQRGAFESDQLDGQLHDASVQFINSPDNVSVDHASKTVRLSKIFDWYEADFVRFVGRGKASIVDFLLMYAQAELVQDLERARDDGYVLVYHDYDWSINDGTL